MEHGLSMNHEDFYLNQQKYHNKLGSEDFSFSGKKVWIMCKGTGVTRGDSTP